MSDERFFQNFVFNVSFSPNFNFSLMTEYWLTKKKIPDKDTRENEIRYLLWALQ